MGGAARLLAGVERSGRAFADALDEHILGNTGRLAVNSAFSLSRRARSAHTGDANYGLFGVVLGLLALTLVILLEVRFLQ
jgi:hypothetical protein